MGIEEDFKETAKERRASLDDRCRVVCFGIIAVFWAIIGGEDKLSLSTCSMGLLILAAALSVATLVGDYTQMFLEFGQAEWSWRDKAGTSAQVAFWVKHALMLLAAATLICSVLLILARPSVAHAQDQQWWNSYWDLRPQRAGFPVQRLKLCAPTYTPQRVWEVTACLGPVVNRRPTCQIRCGGPVTPSAEDLKVRIELKCSGSGQSADQTQVPSLNGWLIWTSQSKEFVVDASSSGANDQLKFEFSGHDYISATCK